MQRWIRLCAESDGESMMLTRLGQLLGEQKLITGTMPYLCAEWKANKLKRYSANVQKDYGRMADTISEAFAAFTVAQVKTKTCADFLRANFADKANTAQKYANVLRKMFRYAISEMGLRDDNPCDQLDLSDYETKRREKLPTHEQFAAIRTAALTGDDGLPTESGPTFQCIVDMAYLCWQRGVDIRTLKETQIDDQANLIRFKPSKTAKTSGKVLDIAITPAIRAVIDRARAIKRTRKMISPYLFPTRDKTPYTKSGLNSAWVRARTRAKIVDDILFRDLRALGATDAAKAGSERKDIQRRLAHTSGKTSEIYIKEAIPETSILDVKLPWKDA
ncbi:tyrosine-type recombinase/integrase [Pandoraea apista]|uniref:tyrosine-type recombinase/integrase n=1 Tax=Pandoraea apista TaxID=93218 RepID=UPI0015E77442|nr:tyrosine-type recombinase/integrase [Pandoraea apista]